MTNKHYNMFGVCQKGSLLKEIVSRWIRKILQKLFNKDQVKHTYNKGYSPF
jgi:hypothetical protein